MKDIVELYLELRADERLQKNWETNQPRPDRVFEAPLIARTPREVATAAVLAFKMKYAVEFVDAEPGEHVYAYVNSMSNPHHRGRVQNVLKGNDTWARAAMTHSVRFYLDRANAPPLLRHPWSDDSLRQLAQAEPQDIVNPTLKPTCGPVIGGTCISHLADLFLSGVSTMTDADLRKTLRSKEFPGLGEERTDAVGVFGFRMPWPVMDDYLWELLTRHRLLREDEMPLSNRQYRQRRRVFQPYWEALLKADLGDPGEIAATLYLWADEAAKFGYVYGNS